tara:strand:- start:377 stop:1753 length:1377 start_codon:yes stop_codon:yes gene_type:complete
MKDFELKQLLNAQVKLHRDAELLLEYDIDNRATNDALEYLANSKQEIDNKFRLQVCSNDKSAVIDRRASYEAEKMLGDEPGERYITVHKKTINQLIDEAPSATIFDLTSSNHVLACVETIRSIRDEHTSKMSSSDIWVSSFAGMLGGIVELFIGKNEIASSLTESGLDQQGIKQLESEHYVSYDAANSSHIKKSWSDLSGSDKKSFMNLDSASLDERVQEYKQAFRHNKQLFDQGAFSNLNCKGHHFDSPAHDILGFVYAIKDQIEGQCTLYSPELKKMVTVIKPGSAMEGGYTIENIILAAKTFLGHFLSDVNGSNGTAGGGAGLGFPGYSLLLNQAGIDSGVANLARDAYLEGYDFREFLSQGLAVAIPKIVLWVYKKITGVSDVIYKRMCTIAYGVVASISLAKFSFGDFRLNYIACSLFTKNAIGTVLDWMREEEVRKKSTHDHIMRTLESSLA